MSSSTSLLCAVPFIAMAACSCGDNRSAPSGDATSAGAGGLSNSEPDPSADGGQPPNGDSDSESGAGGALPSGTGGHEDVRAERGRVVDFETGRPLAGRRVLVASTLTKRTPVVETDQDGFFDFEAAKSYQALIVEPDASTVSYYEGLTGSDPVLVHNPSRRSAGSLVVGNITGSLSGGATYPLTGMNDMVVVHFLSAEVTTRAYIGVPALEQGPEYALWPAFTRPKLPATVLALGIFRDPTDSNAYSAAAAMKELIVERGQVYTHDLELEPVPLGRVAGKVQVPAGWDFVQTSEYYRFPIPEARVAFPYAPQTRINPLTHNGSFEYVLPDLRGLGGQLCVAGIAREAPSGNDDAPDGDGSLWSEQCAVALDGDSIDIEFEAIPTLTAPAAGAKFGAGTRFSWSRAGSVSAPNLVRLDPGDATPQTPLINIFTTNSVATLPDLAQWGIQLPVSAEYSARPVALASDASDAFAADGLGALMPRSRRTSAPSGVTLVVGP